MSYISFIPTGLSDSGKTQIWRVQTTSGIVLGDVKWFAQWRKYAFSPIAGTVYDEMCLHEIADYVRNETFKHKRSE